MPSNATENKPIQPQKALLIKQFPHMLWDRIQISEQNAKTLLNHLTELKKVESRLKNIPQSKNLTALKRWLNKEIKKITDNPNADFSRPINYLAPHDKPHFEMLIQEYPYLIPENSTLSEQDAHILNTFLDHLKIIELELEKNPQNEKLINARNMYEELIEKQLNIKKINFF